MSTIKPKLLKELSKLPLENKKGISFPVLTETEVNIILNNYFTQARKEIVDCKKMELSFFWGILSVNMNHLKKKMVNLEKLLKQHEEGKKHLKESVLIRMLELKEIYANLFELKTEMYKKGKTGRSFLRRKNESEN